MDLLLPVMRLAHGRGGLEILWPHQLRDFYIPLFSLQRKPSGVFYRCEGELETCGHSVEQQVDLTVLVFVWAVLSRYQEN